jgi:hypothetical protein
MRMIVPSESSQARQMSAEIDLLSCFEAQVWAKEFVRIVKNNPTIPTDEGTMLAWFASALMTGYDEHARRMKRLTQPTTERRGI